MSVKHIFVQTCQLIVLLNFTHTYVLFAANLDDFRSIAKKFIPDKLADQLTNMAAHNSIKYRQQHKQGNIDKSKVTDKDTEEYSDEAEATKPAVVREIKTTPKKRFAIKDQTHDVDFDELVDRVREQLEHKFKDKLKKEPIKEYRNKDEYYDISDENTKELDRKHVDQIKTTKIKDITRKTTKTTLKTKYTTKSTTENAQIYYDDEPAEPLAENDGMFFKEADLTKTKDSYEDYVRPDKDVFESDETKTTRAQRLPSEKESRYKSQRLKAEANDFEGPSFAAVTEKTKEVSLDDDEDYTEHRSEEVKAKTESLSREKPGNTQKKLKGTMIPTREYYKMSSPNYYAKLPAVAEKYDFNEPLPERDREPEDLKYFVNPPASINKKVKLTSN